jgi:hypothetical protein
MLGVEIIVKVVILYLAKVDFSNLQEFLFAQKLYFFLKYKYDFIRKII